MIEVPDVTPVTTPEAVTVATDVVLLVQDVPPVVASVSTVVAPAHIAVVPEIGATAAFTVT